MRLRISSLALGTALAVSALVGTGQATEVTAQGLLEAQGNAGEWLMYGRDYRNNR